MINSPQSPVPQAPPSGQVMFYRLGSGARIPVQCSPSWRAWKAGSLRRRCRGLGRADARPFNAAFAANLLTNAVFATTGGGQVTFTTTTSHSVAVGAVFEIGDATAAPMLPAGYKRPIPGDCWNNRLHAGRPAYRQSRCRSDRLR